MIGRAHRLTSSDDFRAVVRQGGRAGASTLVTHVVVAALSEGEQGSSREAQVGLVVSKAVGTAVTRNRVKRRLRHLAAERLELVPPGSQLVLRALPASATASYAELGADLDQTLRRALDQALARARSAASTRSSGRGSAQAHEGTSA